MIKKLFCYCCCCWYYSYINVKFSYTNIIKFGNIIDQEELIKRKIILLKEKVLTLFYFSFRVSLLNIQLSKSIYKAKLHNLQLSFISATIKVWFDEIYIDKKLYMIEFFECLFKKNDLYILFYSFYFSRCTS